jgi:hypothetical protein
MATTDMKITQCVAAGNSIIVVYSVKADVGTAAELGKIANFLVTNPPGGTPIDLSRATASYQDSIPGTVISPVTLPAPDSPFNVIVSVTALGSNNSLSSLREPLATLKADFDSRADAATGAVSGVATAIGIASGGVAGAIGDATSYPFLTEEIGLGRGSGLNSPGPSGGTSLAQTVGVALQQVLGWKIKTDDPKGFVGALTQSFCCKDFEGHTECTWTPRSYAVQTDLAGGITGAQASIFARAKEAVDQSLPLLDGLYPLRPDADKEFIEAARSVVRSQSTALVEELGIPGGPRPARVDQIFSLLLGDPETNDPDFIAGELGTLRVQLGLRLARPPVTPPSLTMTARQTQQFEATFTDPSDVIWSMSPSVGSGTTSATGLFTAPASILTQRTVTVTATSKTDPTRTGNATITLSTVGVAQGPPFPEPVNLANSVEDEQDQTNFRIIVDYLSSLRSSWDVNRKFFTRDPSVTAFFGTQLVLLSRQLSVVAETVDEVRFTLDSVFIGPSERQTLPLVLFDENGVPTNIFVEEFLSWVYSFASSEGPALIQEGGKFAVSGSFLQIATRLRFLAKGLTGPLQLPNEAGFHTQRVQRSLGELSSQLQVLLDQTGQIQGSPF